MYDLKVSLGSIDSTMIFANERIGNLEKLLYTK